MATIKDLPVELLLQIGWKLNTWEDIYGFTSVCQQLRKHLDYAKYARKKFVYHRHIHTTTRINKPWQGVNMAKEIIHLGDDRQLVYGDSRNVVEFWRCRYSWIDYRARFWEGEITSLTWIYLPYGDNFNGKEYVLKLRMSARRLIQEHWWLCYCELNQKSNDICAVFRKCSRKLKMYSRIEEEVKGRYDELFSEAVFKEMGKGNELIRYLNQIHPAPGSSSSYNNNVGYRLCTDWIFVGIVNEHNKEFCDKIVNPKDYRTHR